MNFLYQGLTTSFSPPPPFCLSLSVQKNPLGMQGQVAETYGALLDDMWSGKCSTCSPRQFKVWFPFQPLLSPFHTTSVWFPFLPVCLKSYSLRVTPLLYYCMNPCVTHSSKKFKLSAKKIVLLIHKFYLPLDGGG